MVQFGTGQARLQRRHRTAKNSSVATPVTTRDRDDLGVVVGYAEGPQHDC
jgi:hypothetical protein